MKRRYVALLAILVFIPACLLVPIDSHTVRLTEAGLRSCINVEGTGRGIQRLSLLKGDSIAEIKINEAAGKYDYCFAPNVFKLYIL